MYKVYFAHKSSTHLLQHIAHYLLPDHTELYLKKFLQRKSQILQPEL